MSKTGIYKIQSKIKSDKIYIGSAINIKKRWSYHLTDLKNNKHGNQRLQRHYNKYGESDLEFSVIIECSQETLIAFEQFYIDSLNPWFNICKIAGSTLGRKASFKTKLKLSESHKGKTTWIKGKNHSEETRKKIGEASRNRVSGMKGKKMTDIQIKKLSDAHKGQIAWNKGMKNCYSQETLEKMSLSKKGKKYSEETRRKVSESHKGLNTWTKGRKLSKETIEKRTNTFKLNRLNK
jgi:group I intron endonuclease